jgi:hypothetical protein
MRVTELTTLTSFSSASNGGANHYRPRRGQAQLLASPSDALVLGRLAELVNPSVHERPQPRFQKNPSVDCGQLRLIADDRLRHDGGVLTHSEQR